MPRLNVSSLLFPCFIAWYMKTAHFLILGIMGEVISTLLKETAIPGKAFVVIWKNGVTKSSVGRTDMRIDSLSSCLRSSWNLLLTKSERAVTGLSSLVYGISGTLSLGSRKVITGFGEMCLVLGRWGYLVSHSRKKWRRDCVPHPCACLKNRYWDYNWLGNFVLKQDFYWETTVFTMIGYVRSCPFRNILILKINNSLYITNAVNWSLVC